jgi:integrase
MACKVKVNRHGYLALRLYWDRRESWEGTGLSDTPKNRRRVEARAELINEEIEAGKFAYLKWFPEGNKAEEFKPKEITKEPNKVGEYFCVWIESKKPPAVRKGLERDYREHFRRYILPQFENLSLKDVSPRKLLDFRTYLTGERGLKMKSARTIMDASFRAMMRDARKVDHLIDTDPFAALDWPRLPSPKPNPFTEKERDDIIGAFKEKSRFYYPFVYLLFWTGMRPSEALALRWEDIDLRHGFLSISKSRYMGTENGTKTAASEREIRLLPDVIGVLRALKPLHVEIDEHVFKNQEGQLLDFHTWRSGIWYRILRGTGICERKPYSTRHTFISASLSNDVNIKWLAEYCGTSVAMIEKHYGKYIGGNSDEQFLRLLGAKTEILAETVSVAAGQKSGKLSEFRGEKIGGPTWSRTRDQPVMSRWL